MLSKPPFIAQERSDTCMLACLRMIFAFHGSFTSEAELLKAIDPYTSGVDPEQLAELAARHGLRAEAQVLTLQEIRTLVEVRRFPIVLVDRTFLDREFAVHAVIPIRFSRRFVTFLDPLRGERRISLKRFSQAQTRVGGWSVTWEMPGEDNQ